MKKRVLSLLLALALCLTLLPPAAFAEEDGADTTTAQEQEAEPDAQPEPSAEDDEDDAQVLSVQAMIDALPDADELDGMESGQLDDVYTAVQSAYDAYEALTEDQQSQLTGADCFAALFGWFNQQTAPLADVEVRVDGVDAETGHVEPGAGISRRGPVYEGSTGDDSLSGQFYIVQGDVTVNGNLTIDGTANGGLVLCADATLTVRGALIHTGGNNFYIFGQTRSGGSGTGQLVIENSRGDGAAIRSTAASTPSLSISSGELTIYGGSSKTLIDGVYLSSSSSVHQGTLNGKSVTPAAWSNVTPVEGTELLLAYCAHDEDYTYIKDSAALHHWRCNLCGFAASAVDHDLVAVEWNAETHTIGCNLCGYKSTPESHTFEDAPHPYPTPDGKGHSSQACEACGYTSGKSDPHAYDEFGECTVCGFTPLLEGADDNLYEGLEDAIESGETELKLVSKAATSEINVAFDFDYPGKTVTLDMAGYPLTNSRGNPTLRVESGTLTVTGSAVISQTGTYELASSAVRVSGGKLIFANGLTAQGAEDRLAVEVTGGTLDMQGAVKLSGGLKVSGSEALVTPLKAGDVLGGGVFVDSGTAAQLLGENLAFAKTDAPGTIVKGNVTSISEDVTVVAHTHTMDGSTCTACGYTCSHQTADGSSAFENGVCSKCGYTCTHGKVTEQDGKYTCNTCGAQMVAEDSRGTYYAGIVKALNDAPFGSEVTLLTNVTIEGDMNYAGGEGESKDLTLNLNGHNFTCIGTFSIGKGQVEFNSVDAQTGANLSFSGHGDINANIVVKLDGYLGLYSWEGGTVKSVRVEATSDNSLIGGTFGSPDSGIDGTIQTLQLVGESCYLSIWGGTYGEIINNTGSPITLGSMFRTQNTSCAFYNNEDGTPISRATQIENGGSLRSVTVKECTAHADGDNDQKCDYCNTKVTASVTTKSGETACYKTLSDAFKAAGYGDTVALVSDVDLGDSLIDTTLFPVEKLDLNGKTLSKSGSAGGCALQIGGPFTICDTSGEQTGKITSASGYAVYVSGGRLTVISGSFGSVCFESGTAEISGGSFDSISTDLIGKPLGSLLANGYAFADGTTGEVGNYYNTTTATNVTVVAHEKHSYDENGVCACGAVCGHTEMDEATGTCRDCGVLLAQASVTAGGSLTCYRSLTDAISAAASAEGSVLKLMQDVEIEGDNSVSISSGTFTVDWNGYRLTGSTWNHLLIINQTANVTLKDSSEGGNGGVTNSGLTCGAAVCISVQNSCTVTIEGGAYSPQVLRHAYCYGTVRIKGGVFESPAGSGQNWALYNVTGTLADLLADGYAFAYDADGSELLDAYSDSHSEANRTVYAVAHPEHTFDSETGKCACGYACPHAEVGDDGVCKNCGVQMSAKVLSGEKTAYYVSLSDAVGAAKDGDTVMMLRDVTLQEDTLPIRSSIALDLNGWTLSGYHQGEIVTLPVGISANVTIRDTSDEQTGCIVNERPNNEAISVQSGTLTVESGSFGAVRIILNGDAKISGGTFESIFVGTSPSKTLGVLLTPGHAFADADDETNIEGYYTLRKAENVTVVAHRHSGATCVCGYVCPHDWSNKDGKCTLCGYACPHSEDVNKADGVYTCTTCGQTMTAAVVAPDPKGTVTYYGDGTYPNSSNSRSGLDAAFEAASSGSIVTVLSGGSTVTAYLDGTDGKALTLILNGKDIGYLYVGRYTSKNSLTVTGSGHIASLFVHADSTADLTGWTDTMDSLYVYSGGKVTLNGGTFAKVTTNGQTVGSLLAEGYAFQKTDGTYVAYVSTNDMTDVKVVKCTAHMDSDGDARCDYCNRPASDFTASVRPSAGTGVTYYDDLAEAFAAAKSGDTVTLVQNVALSQSLDTSRYASGIILDLNGKTLSGEVDAIIIIKNGDLTIRDSSGANSGSIINSSGCAMYMYSGTLTIHGGTFKGSLGGRTLDSQGGSVTIEGGVWNSELTMNCTTVIKGGIFNGLVVIHKDCTISGGTFSGINAVNRKVGDLLADGCALKTDSGWADETAAKAENVTVVQAPIQSVSLTATTTTVTYGNVSPARVSQTYTVVGDGELTQTWYVNGKFYTRSTDHRFSYDLPSDSSAGNYVIRVVFSKDGYSVTKELTITVEPADITGATVTPAALTYNGTAQAPAVEVKNGDTTLTEGTDYTVNATAQTDAGSYTLTVTGMGNYVGTISDVEWTISPAPLTITDADVPNKKYDGTTTATVDDVTFSGLVNGESLTLGTDYTVTGAFQSADANNQTTQSVTVTVTLNDSVKNYTLGESTFVVPYCRIVKADIDDLDVPVTIRNGVYKTYVVALPDLPALEAPKSYGSSAPSYSLDRASYEGDGYAVTAELDASSTPKVLKLTVTATNDHGSSELPAFAVRVVTDNYYDILINVKVTAMDKVIPTGEPTLSADRITYGDALDSITLSGTMQDRNTDVPGTFTWTQPDAVPDAGYCEAEWKFVPTDGDNYDAVTGKADITIDRKSISGAEIALGASLTYNGQEQTQTVAAVKLGSVTLTAGQDYTVSASSGTNAGSYTLTIQGTGNYTGTAKTDWTIAAKDVRSPRIELEDTSFPYDNGREIKPAVTVKDGETVIPASEYAVSYENNINAGTATVVISNKEGGNYQVKEVGTEFTITRVASSITAAPKANTLTYNGTEQPLVTAGTAEGGTMQYGIGATLNDPIPTATNAGTYTVYYIVKGDANHNDSDQQSVTVTIAKAEVTVTAEDKTSRVGQELRPLTYTCEPAPFAGDSFTGELATAADMNTAGETAITQGTLSLGDNYLLTFVPGTYTVAAKQPQSGFAFAESEVSKTYGDADFTIAASGAAAGSEVTYTSSNASVATVDGSGTVHIVGAGQTTITAKAAETADDLEATTSYTLTVARKSVTAPAADATVYTYNGEPQTYQLATDEGYAILGSLTETNANEAGYAITVSLTDKANTQWADTEDSTDKTFRFVIRKAAVTVTAEDKTSRVGQELLPLTYTCEPAPFAGDSFTGTLATAADMNTAGETAITQGTLDLGNNYSITFVPGTYTVAAKQPQSGFAFTEGDQAKTYGDADFTIAASGAAAGSEVTYGSSDTSVATVDGSGTVHIVGAGQTTITAKAAETADDLEATTSYTLTVARKSVTAPTADTTVYTYNGTAQTYQLATGEGYAILGSLTETNANEAGYAITVSLTDKANAQWADTEDSADRTFRFVIRKAAVTVTATDKSAYTGSAAPDLGNPVQDTDYTVSGLLNGDTLEGTVTLTYDGTPDMTKAGTAAIRISGTLANDNYTITYVSGTLTVTTRPSSGGGGGSSSGSGAAKTETTTNPDGSTTKTETKADGTVTETTTNPDGSTTRTETKTDGSSVTESTTANGSSGTVKTDENGKTEADAKISDKAIADAKQSGEAVKVPTEVKAGEDSNSAPTVKIDLPRNAGETTVEIPVRDVSSGTVAVIVHEDGTEEIVKDSIPTEDGIQLTVSGSTTVKIIDNAKDFIDTRDHWAKSSIDFVSARGLVNGISDTLFAPNASTTRAQLWTILARKDGADLTGGATWYEKAQAWSKLHGISDGTNPNGTITRAQMVAMLWRAAGAPQTQIVSSFTDVTANSYYAQAVAWAVQQGITTGTGDGKFSPNATCTRAQIATFLRRSYQK